MSFLLTLQDEASDLIQGIIQNDYNFNWGSINVRDQAFIKYPSAWIIFTDEAGEQTIDQPVANAYDNVVLMEISIKTKLDETNTDPRFTNRNELYKALEDIKKAFKDGLGSANDTNYVGFEIVDSEGKDIFTPSHAVMRWSIHYSQDRTNPDTIGCT